MILKILSFLLELGINFNFIFKKTIYVLIPRKTLNLDVLSDADLSGPVVFQCIFSFMILLVFFFVFSPSRLFVGRYYKNECVLFSCGSFFQKRVTRFS